MAAKKYYAVKKGKVTGLFKTWAECKDSVDGYPGAEYKGFALLEEAEGYLGIEPHPLGDSDGTLDSVSHSLGEWEDFSAGAAHLREKTEEVAGEETLLAYVDGSYDDSLKKYAFGCVFILPDGRTYVEFGNGDNEQSLQHRNVTGEMLGAMYAVKTAMRNGYKHVEICYDYQGIEKWVTGEWRSKTELTKKYAQSMREWGKDIKLSFIKVAAHTNEYYNELADKMAKRGLREGNGVPKVRLLEEMEQIEA